MKSKGHNLIIGIIIAIMIISPIIAIIGGIYATLNSSTPEVVNTVPYTVKNGDTLWNIARQSNGYGELSTRRIVDDIKRLSDCSDDIKKGQVILVPVYDH